MHNIIVAFTFAAMVLAPCIVVMVGGSVAE
jgi:hypothetical protein